jgi:hypothetical protein
LPAIISFSLSPLSFLPAFQLPPPFHFIDFRHYADYYFRRHYYAYAIFDIDADYFIFAFISMLMIFDAAIAITLSIIDAIFYAAAADAARYLPAPLPRFCCFRRHFHAMLADSAARLRLFSFRHDAIFDYFTPCHFFHAISLSPRARLRHCPDADLR